MPRTAKSDGHRRHNTEISSVCCICSGKPRRADIKFLKHFSSDRSFDLSVGKLTLSAKNRMTSSRRSCGWNLGRNQGWQMGWCFHHHATPGQGRDLAIGHHQPLRDLHWAWGFPWLTGQQKQLVESHNYMRRQCCENLLMGLDFALPTDGSLD